MKTIGKLRIEKEKILNDEELLTLKGGSTMCWYDCSCSGSTNPPYSSSPFSMACFSGECINAVVQILEERCVDGEGTCNQTMCL